MKPNRDTLENIVASAVDFTSIMVAYTIGVSQSDFTLGLAYGVFDAFMVVWMRKPITRALRYALRPGSRKLWKGDTYVTES